MSLLLFSCDSDRIIFIVSMCVSRNAPLCLWYFNVKNFSHLSVSSRNSVEYKLNYETHVH